LVDEDCVVVIVVAEGDLDGAILANFGLAFTLELIAFFTTVPCEVDVALQQPVPVLREGRVVPRRAIDANPDESAKQYIKLQPLHQQALRPACSIARSSFSGAIEGHPMLE
jgi:hypothetical protein